MLQEAHIWNREKQDRWRKTREKGCLSYVLKTTAMALLGAVAISLLYYFFTLVSGVDFQMSTAWILLVVALVSGLITGRTYWGLSESSFEQMES